MIVHNNNAINPALYNTNQTAAAQNEPTNRVGAINEQQGQQTGVDGVRERQNRVDDTSGQRRVQEENEARQEEAEQRRLEAIARREESIENVIARSEDGDTLQVEEENADINHEDIGEVVARGGAVAVPPPREEINAPEVEEDEAVVNATEDVAPAAMPPERQSAYIAPNPEQAGQVVPNMGQNPEQRPGSVEEEQRAAIGEEENFDLDEEAASEMNTQAQVEAQNEAARERREQIQEEQERQTEQREEQAKEAEEQRVEREAVEAQQQASADFKGITDAGLEQMYLQGEISRYDYETEIGAREAQRQQEMMESNTEFSVNMNNIDRAGREVENNAAAISAATSDNANDTLTAEQRLETMETLQRDNVNEARREEDERIVWQAQFLE